MSFSTRFGMLSRLRSSELSFESPNDLQMTSKWLKWPLGPENITFLPNLTFGHVICLFIGFVWRWVDCAYQIWVSSHQMTSKWPKNDLKWPIRTWKLNFLTKSHFGACNMSFHRFFWKLSWLCLLEGQFWDFRSHLEDILRSFRGQVNFFFEIIVVQWISCGTWEKKSLQLYSKCQTHPEVNFGTLEVI